jgi:hypothetical protein
LPRVTRAQIAEKQEAGLLEKRYDMIQEQRRMQEDSRRYQEEIIKDMERRRGRPRPAAPSLQLLSASPLPAVSMLSALSLSVGRGTPRCVHLARRSWLARGR